MSLVLQLASGGGAEGHPHTLLDPHGAGLIFWTAVIFSIVAITLYKLAWAPLLEALGKREQAISGAIDEAARTRAEAEKLRLRYEEQLEGVRQEAQKIIDEGEADKKRIIAEARAKATQEADEIKARAERDIALAKTKALAEVKQTSALLAMAIAEKVIQAEVDGNRHKKIVDEVLTSYEKS
ncbi:MAG: F0F1 ATP synthase subunit B [Planctomycetota bacterium]